MWNESEYERGKRLRRRHELLNRYDLAERLDVSPDTILKWARQGRIPVVRLSRKVLRFDYDGIVAALRKKAVAEFAPPIAAGKANAAKPEL